MGTKGFAAAPQRIGAALLLGLMLALPARAEPVLWRISDADSVMYVFGTIHIVPERTAWFTPRIRAALGEADRVWTEIDLGGVGGGQLSPAIREAFARHAVAPPGTPDLSTRISPAAAEKLRARYASLGVPAANYERFRPWMAALTFSIAEAAVRPAPPPTAPPTRSGPPADPAPTPATTPGQAPQSRSEPRSEPPPPVITMDRDGKAPQPPVTEGNAVRRAVANAPDVVVTESAVSRGLERRTLETIEQQLAFYAALSPAEEIAMLEGVLRDPDLSWNARGGQSLNEAWAAGDLPVIVDRVAAFTGGDDSAFAEVFVRKRNRVWVDRLAEALAGSGTDFVAVGVAHTVGRDSLPDLLRARGFAVERVNDPGRSAASQTR